MTVGGEGTGTHQADDDVSAFQLLLHGGVALIDLPHVQTQILTALIDQGPVGAVAGGAVAIVQGKLDDLIRGHLRVAAGEVVGGHGESRGTAGSQTGYVVAINGVAPALVPLQEQGDLGKICAGQIDGMFHIFFQRIAQHEVFGLGIPGQQLHQALRVVRQG